MQDGYWARFAVTDLGEPDENAAEMRFGISWSSRTWQEAIPQAWRHGHDWADFWAALPIVLMLH